MTGTAARDRSDADTRQLAALGYTSVWPRTPDAPWYDNYLVLISGVVVVGTGLLLLAGLRPYRHSSAIAGDATETQRR